MLADIWNISSNATTLRTQGGNCTSWDRTPCRCWGSPQRRKLYAQEWASSSKVWGGQPFEVCADWNPTNVWPRAVMACCIQAVRPQGVGWELAQVFDIDQFLWIKVLQVLEQHWPGFRAWWQWAEWDSTEGIILPSVGCVVCGLDGNGWTAQLWRHDFTQCWPRCGPMGVGMLNGAQQCIGCDTTQYSPITSIVLQAWNYVF